MINSTNEIFTIVFIIRSKELKGKRKRDKWKTNSFNTRLIVRNLGHLNSLLLHKLTVSKIISNLSVFKILTNNHATHVRSTALYLLYYLLHSFDSEVVQYLLFYA